MNQIAETTETTTIIASVARPTLPYLDLMDRARHRLDSFGLGEHYLLVLRAIDNDGAEEKRSYETVSKMLSIPVGTVRSRASRARAVIAKQLEAEARK